MEEVYRIDLSRFDFVNRVNIRNNVKVVLNKIDIKKHIDDKVVRSVLIKVSSQVAEQVWHVEWEAIHLHNGIEIERNCWVSTLFVEMRENTLKSEDKFLNPIGFTVIGYAVSKRED